MVNKIRAMLIFEMLGRPPEHVKETMSQLVDKLGELPGIEICKKTVHEPKPVEDKNAKDLFTTFAEVEILGNDINNLVNLVFFAMPSHIEIIEPGELILRNNEISGLLSSLTVKLHRYDEIAKAIVLERNVLINKLKELGVTSIDTGLVKKQLDKKTEDTKVANKKTEKGNKTKKTKKNKK